MRCGADAVSGLQLTDQDRLQGAMAMMMNNSLIHKENKNTKLWQ
jgi:hypothetical protein